MINLGMTFTLHKIFSLVLAQQYACIYFLDPCPDSRSKSILKIFFHKNSLKTLMEFNIFFCFQPEIRPMIGEGVRGFKCFLIHSGIDEFPHCTEPDLHKAYEQLQGTDSVFLVSFWVHNMYI